jgi:hypothetical protein
MSTATLGRTAALFVVALSACGESATPADSSAVGGAAGAGAGAAPVAGVGGGAAASAGSGGSSGAGGSAGASGQNQSGTESAGSVGVAGSAGTGGVPEPAGPEVDRSEPQLYHFDFTAKEADMAATLALATQHAYLDTRVEPVGKLVVYLHGAGEPTNCGSGALAELVAGWGFHWFAPCYVSNYGVGNCGDDIGGCRLEAFEGVDHHQLIQIGPADSIEGRVVAGLKRLQNENPEGDWQFFIDGDKPRWSKIAISGSSHGASSSGLVGIYRAVERVVMLAGPLDTNQAWLALPPITPIEKYFGFTHTADEQHTGHLAAFTTLKMLGQPALVDSSEPPYGESHRLFSSRATDNGHGAVSDGNITDYHQVWRHMFGVTP